MTKTLKEVRPTMFFGVPRVWEKFQEALAPMVSQVAAGRDLPINQGNNTT